MGCWTRLRHQSASRTTSLHSGSLLALPHCMKNARADLYGREQKTAPPPVEMLVSLRRYPSVNGTPVRHKYECSRRPPERGIAKKITIRDEHFEQACAKELKSLRSCIGTAAEELCASHIYRTKRPRAVRAACGSPEHLQSSHEDQTRRTRRAHGSPAGHPGRTEGTR